MNIEIIKKVHFYISTKLYNIKMTSLRIGIIGYGFIGKAVTSELLLRNHNIKVLDRNEKVNNLPIDWVKGDFRDKNLISKFIKDLDILIHLASSTVPASSKLSVQNEIRENIASMLQILDLIIKQNPCLYIIFASSASIYGNQSNFPITELNLPKPISLYGLQKLTIEHFLQIYHIQYNLNYASCRISNPYGLGQKVNTMQGLLSIIKNNINSNKKIIIYGQNECSRDFIHIKDVARALALFCDRKPINTEVNISSGNEVKIIDLVENIEKLFNKNIVTTFKPLRSTDIGRSVLDNNLIKSLIQWKPKVDLDSGIKEYFK